MAFRLSVAEQGLRTQWDDLIYAMAGGDVSTIALIKGIISTESEWNPGAINPADPSYGLMQILAGSGGPFPAVRPDDLLDPSTNITLGSTFLVDLLRRYGSPGAIAAYNAGSPRLNSAGQYVNSRGDTMVQAYVDSVLTYQTWFLNRLIPPADAYLTVGAPPGSVTEPVWPAYDPYAGDVYWEPSGAAEPGAGSPTLVTGSVVAIALLAVGALWWSQRT
jgi:hypothetical protein